jgi:hypothetical protein
LEKKYNDQVAQAKSIEQQRDVVQTSVKPLQTQLRDLSEVKKQLLDSLIKEMKNFNKKNFDKITKYAKTNSTDFVVTFVMDSITKFLSGDSKATFIGQGAPYFVDADDLQM